VANRSGGGYAASWFIIGVLTGVAATLAALIFLGWRWPGRQAYSEPPPAPAASRPMRHAELKPRPVQEAPPPSAQPTPDQQVVEDAAAAGMTSRSRGRPPQ
jgi:hypothetical protein